MPQWDQLHQEITLEAGAENRGAIWTVDEIRELAELLEAGCPHTDLAIYFHRTLYGVQCMSANLAAGFTPSELARRVPAPREYRGWVEGMDPDAAPSLRV